eukprot:8597165-Pyramimonas_sp.AAC.1
MHLAILLGGQQDGSHAGPPRTEGRPSLPAAPRPAAGDRGNPARQTRPSIRPADGPRQCHHCWR